MGKRMKETLVVNMFGAPGTGKSTMASHIFSLLKWNNIDCEIVNEVAKEKVWEDSHYLLENQLLITAKQYHRLWRLNGKVDVIVTDSPLLLGTVYSQKEPELFKPLVVSYFKRFNNLNFFLKRIKPFHQNGRLQTERESDTLSRKIYLLFKLHCDRERSYVFDSTEEKAEEIYKLIVSHTGQN